MNSDLARSGPLPNGADALPFTLGDRPYDVVKPFLDRVVAAVVLVLLLPLLLVVALAIRLDSPGPVIFCQKRLGKDGKPFTMFKFRTMIANSAETPHRAAFERFFYARPSLNPGTGSYKLRNDPRITRVGGVLRSTSLDELPQLVNVLIGDMSLVGPRPPIPYEAELYEPWHWGRLAVKPGITGPWQATARSRVCFEDMVAMDLKYVSSYSFGGDLRILAHTVVTVLSRDGAG